MDPLSITVSSVALAQLVNVSLRAAYSFRQAKPELIALYNEISDLLIFLRQLEADLERQSHSRGVLPPSAGLAQVVVSIKSKFQELFDEVSEWNPNSSSVPSRNNLRGIRRLGIAYQAKKYKEEFRSLADRLSTFLGVTGA